MSEVKKTIDNILKKHELKPESLMPVLQDIQDKFHYLSEKCLKEVAKRLKLPLNRVFFVATFYNTFSLTPKGKYIIQVCMGTACHVRGAPAIVEEVERLLDIKRGETTKDKKFSLETVNCLGTCALGPVMLINGNYHGHLRRDKVESVVKEYK